MANVKKTRRVGYRKRYNAKKRASKPSKMFAKKVQSVINKNAENKISFGALSTSYYNSGINSVADVVSLISNISKGTDDNQRIGDQCRLQSHVIKGCLQLASPSATGAIQNCRIAVRVMVVKPKQFNNMADVIANGNIWTSYLLKKGGATSGFTGVVSDLWAPINTDAITKYYDKRFYLNTAYQASSVGFANVGDSIKFFTINLKGKNKLLKYDANVDSGLTPTNYAPCILLGYVKLDGSAPDTITTLVSMSWDSVIGFQDI